MNNILKNRIFHNLKILLHKILINYREKKKSNFIVEKAGKQHQVIKDNITGDGSNKNHVSPDGMK